MDLSIVIVNYNGAEFIVDCLASLYSGSTAYKFEVIVVDNASTDQSLDRIKSTSWPIILIENDQNRGFSAANNQGAKIARGRYLFLLNNDTVVKGDALERLVQFFDSRSDIGILAPKLLNGDGTLQGHGSVFMTWRYHGNTPVSVDFVTGAAMMLPLNFYRSIGGLDENYFFYNEDLDLCKTVKKSGLKIIYFPLAEVVHFGGLSTSTRKMGSIIEGYRGGLYFCRKHYGELIFYLYRIVLFFDLIPRFIWYYVRGYQSPVHWEAAAAYRRVMNLALGREKE